MLKGAVLAIAMVVLAFSTSTSVQQGCKDVTTSLVHLAYPPKRDMRSTVVMIPQKGYMALPDSMSVPVTGLERRDRTTLERLTNPVPESDAAVARGEQTFKQLCVPCHGVNLSGNGPVAAKFIPPIDLLKETTRNRSDGYLYAYIRLGGAVMPSYGAQVDPKAAWDLIHYIRRQQRTSPR